MAKKRGRPAWQLPTQDVAAVKMWVRKKIASGDLSPAAAQAYSDVEETDDAVKIDLFLRDFLSKEQHSKLRTSLRQSRWRHTHGDDFVTVKISKKNYEYLQHMANHHEWSSITQYLQQLIVNTWQSFRNTQKNLFERGLIPQLDPLVAQERAELDAFFDDMFEAKDRKKREASRVRKMRENARKAREKNLSGNAKMGREWGESKGHKKGT